MYRVLKRIERDESAFTLVELLVVIVILGLLASITMLNLGDKAEQARKVKVEADARIIEAALELYKIDEGEYPNSINTLVGKYLKELPKDPWGDSYSFTGGKVNIPSQAQ